jgi:hypothetical protein
MRLLNLISLTIVLLAPLLSCTNIAQEKIAIDKSIMRFHDLYNNEDFESIWNEAGEKLRSASTKLDYEDYMKAIRRKLGRLLASSEVSLSFKKDLKLVTTLYELRDSKFEFGNGSEYFTFEMDDRQLSLIGYNVQSRTLILK